MAMCSTLVFSSEAKAGIKDNSWVNDNMVKIIENTVPMEANTLGESDDKLGYWSMTEKSNYYIIPIKVEHPGQLNITIKADELPSGFINCGLYRDVRLTKEVGNTGSITKNKLELLEKYTVNKGTYYLAMEKSGDSKGTAIKGVIGTILIRSDNRTIKLGRSYCGYFDTDNDSIFYKVNVKEDGYVTLKTNKTTAIRLYDKNKDIISVEKELNSANNYTTTFGLTSGTSYIKLSGHKGGFAIGTQYTKTKAVTSLARELETGKKETFILGADSNFDETCWLKLELKRPTKLKLNTTWLGGFGRLDFNIVYSGATKMYFNDYYLSDSKTSSSIKLADEKEWPAGTYYIGIKKNTLLSSGVFSVEFEKIK